MGMGSFMNEKTEIVLVVEDDAETQEVLCAALELEGYTVHVATNGFEAINTARTLKPDLVLMDIIMPVMDGIEATRELKKDPITRHIPILMVTVVDRKKDIINGLEAGATDYIAKPFFLPELTARVKTALTTKKLYEEGIETKEQLIMSEEKYRQLVQNAGEGILVLQDGMLRFFNPKTIELMGYSEDALTNRPFIKMVHSEDREKVGAYFQDPLVVEERTTSLTFRIITEDGNTKWLETNTVSIHWEDKPASLSFLADITERKRAEEEKKKIQGQLLQAQKMEAVGTLAGGIAHDFNNLLQVVQGYTDLLLHNAGHDERQYLALQSIAGAAKRGAALTRQLLTFSRTMESYRRPLDLNHKVQDVKNLLERTIPKMISIKLELAEDLKIVNADATQVEQMLMNLAVNAKDSMPGGGELIIKTENVVLNEELCRIHPDAHPWVYALLTVSDNGHGMDEKTLGHIFEPFFTTKEIGKGTGLGLAMVYGIVKSHRGFISCSSQPGEGTTSKVYLPTVEQEVEMVPEDKIIAPVAGGKERILLVDDEDIIRDLGIQLLGESGYTVFAVPDGETALELYRKEQKQIDLVILDLLMPGMGGMKCLDELLTINPEARVLISTGYSVDGPTKETVEAKTGGCITKPFDREQILNMIREVLDAH
jgi:PAS domain S-box-containing protein